MHSLKGWGEIKASGKRKVVSVTASAFQLRNYAIMNIEPARFRDILNGNDELAEKMHYIASAWQASQAYDYASVIKHLHMACNEDPDTVYNKYVATIKDDHDTVCKDDHNDQSEKFKGLRDALSHNKEQLKKSTRERLKGFGDGYFTLTDAGKFDFSSTSNLRNLKIQAGNLKKHVSVLLPDQPLRMPACVSVIRDWRIPHVGVAATIKIRKRECVLYQGVQCGPDYDLSVLGNRAVLGVLAKDVHVHGWVKCAPLEKEIFFDLVLMCTLIDIQHARQFPVAMLFECKSYRILDPLSFPTGDHFSRPPAIAAK